MLRLQTQTHGHCCTHLLSSAQSVHLSKATDACTTIRQSNDPAPAPHRLAPKPPRKARGHKKGHATGRRCGSATLAPPPALTLQDACGHTRDNVPSEAVERPPAHTSGSTQLQQALAWLGFIRGQTVPSYSLPLVDNRRQLQGLACKGLQRLAWEACKDRFTKDKVSKALRAALKKFLAHSGVPLFRGGFAS